MYSTVIFLSVVCTRCRYSEELRAKLGVSRAMVYNYIKRIKEKKPPRQGKRGGQWKVDPEVEKQLGTATRSHLITNFDGVADEVVRLKAIRNGTEYKKECKRTSQRLVVYQYHIILFNKPLCMQASRTTENR